MCASSVTPKYFDIVVVLYSVATNLYGHPVICIVFCREDYEFRLIFINLQRISAHPFRYICNAVLDTGDRFLYSCCIVCTLYIYLGVISITVIVDAVFIDDISQWCHIYSLHSGS